MLQQKIPEELLAEIPVGIGMVLCWHDNTGTFHKHGDPKSIKEVSGDKNALNLLCVGASMSNNKNDVYLVYRTEDEIHVVKFEGKHLLENPRCGSRIAN